MNTIHKTLLVVVALLATSSLVAWVDCAPAVPFDAEIRDLNERFFKCVRVVIAESDTPVDAAYSDGAFYFKNQAKLEVCSAARVRQWNLVKRAAVLGSALN